MDVVQAELLPANPPELDVLVVQFASLDRDPSHCWLSPDKALKDSVAKLGILQPIVVHEYENGTYRLVDGYRRVEAAEAAGLTSAPAVSINGEINSDVISLAIHATRKPNLAAELASIERLVAEGHSEKEIARATGQVVASLRRKMRLVGLNSDLRDLFNAGALAAGTAAKAAKLSSDDQEILSQLYAENGTVTGKDVDDLRRVNVSHEATELLVVVAESMSDQRSPYEIAVAEITLSLGRYAASEHLATEAAALTDIAVTAMINLTPSMPTV